jgi:hypothetical protein
MKYGAFGAPLLGTGYVPVTRGGVSERGLRVLLRLDAMRAGIEAEDLPDGRVRLSSKDLREDLPLDEACTVLAMLHGVRCSPAVLKAAGVRVIR